MKKILLLIIISAFIVSLLAVPLVLAQGYILETQLPPLPEAAQPGAGIAQYIQYVFVFALALSGFLALGMMVLGGLQYVLAAGNAAKVEDAKDKITQALWGLGIILISYLLLRTINPDLVKLKNPDLTPPAIKAAQFQTTGPGAIAPGQIQTTGPGAIAPGQISTGQQCQKDADCTAGGILGGRLVCTSGQCTEWTTGGF